MCHQNDGGRRAGVDVGVRVDWWLAAVVRGIDGYIWLVIINQRNPYPSPPWLTLKSSGD